jgi:deoxyribonuclease-4
MPLFGAHMSIAGGCHNALLHAQAHGCDSVQLFTRNANQWDARPLTAEEIRTFRSLLRKTRLRCPTAHDSYLINLASPDDKLWRRSIEAFLIEVQRAEQLGLRYLVMHPGAAMDSSEDAALARVARALDEVHARSAGAKVKVLLETTAGQGSTLGWRFEHLARILSLVSDAKRLGVCLDTCHVFAAGYALSPAAEYEATFREFDRVVGLRRQPGRSACPHRPGAPRPGAVPPAGQRPAFPRPPDAAGDAQGRRHRPRSGRPQPGDAEGPAGAGDEESSKLRAVSVMTPYWSSTMPVAV